MDSAGPRPYRNWGSSVGDKKKEREREKIWNKRGVTMEGLPGARGKYRWRGGKIRGDPRTPFRDLRSRRRLEEMQAQSPSLGGCGMRRRAGGGGGANPVLKED